jgi:hypothetical protein
MYEFGTILAVNRYYTINSVNQLIFVMVKCGVLFEVWTDFLSSFYD